ncbi:unnamed protein product [Effrenium voratum]|nr:unnamed protein product [Effrenium voratum]
MLCSLRPGCSYTVRVESRYLGAAWAGAEYAFQTPWAWRDGESHVQALEAACTIAAEVETCKPTLWSARGTRYIIRRRAERAESRCLTLATGETGGWLLFKCLPGRQGMFHSRGCRSWWTRA